MRLEKIYIAIVVLSLGLISCNSDDDDSIELIPQEEQNEIDDLAIVKYLDEHYFNEVGKVVKFSEDDASDDDETPLSDIAEYDEMGFWYVKRPDFSANGRQIVDVESDSILIQFDLMQMYASQVSDSVYYSTPSYLSIPANTGFTSHTTTTINTTGYPVWDPSFYHAIEEELPDNYSKSFLEVEGLQAGLKHFNSCDKDITDLPAVDFQGLIIVPSRLAYQRSSNGFSLSADRTLLLNFQLYKVIDRQ